ncbi:MAG: hypothetical protein PHC34_01240 [Candidatus Gastranaerophilales bacterium]|nr:hypothetical protein [Candidatus Gastranaerophilales bacterium]
MALNLVNFIGNLFPATQTSSITKVTPKQSSNPFASPFIGTQNSNQNMYGQNKPVSGGYFAGYYNGKPNIVGSRLFIDV